MTDFLQSNWFLIVGALLALALFAARLFSADREFGKDLRGAIVLLLVFAVLRVIDWALHGQLPSGAAAWLGLLWRLALAFGLIRSAISVMLYLVRLRRVQTPKILRDLLDFSLYALVAIPIVKTQLRIDLTGLLATSAIVSVVIGLALQDTLGNFFAGLSVQLERPFQVGDWVSIKEHTGRVVQIAWRATRIETFRKEHVTLPNQILSKEAVKNYSRAGLPVALDLYFGVSYQNPPNQVKAAVLEALRDIPNLLPDPPPRCRTWHFDESSVRYQIRYFVSDFAHCDNVMEEIWTRLWYRFRRAGIEIPYPQRVMHLRSGESPPEQRTEVVSLLRTVDLFANLSPGDIEGVASQVMPRQFGRGESIISEGAAGNTFYVVSSGQVSVRTGSPPIEVSRLGRGQYFGEMSLLTGEPRSATVVAESDTELLEIDRPVFARMFEAHPELANQLSALLAHRRSALRAAAESSATSSDSAPEARRIFSRLRQIFRLQSDA
ncbi:MAG: cyclic nucleotide-binding domain-containing protein [Myxococcota bacterium]